ncbi:unnamed protein product [Lota lota]
MVAVHTSLYSSPLAEWICCLDKRPSERSGEDVDIILTRLREVKAFQRFPPPLLLQICSCAFYEYLEKGITLFRQGDIGTSWYAVLSGSLDVKVSETANHQDAVTICTLGIGTAFGESILDNTPRHATIVSRESSELLRIEQREFKSLWEKYRQSMAGLLAPPYGAMESGSNNDREHGNPDAFPPPCLLQVPSEKLQRAGKVLRNAILSRAPHMIRDRKYHLKTYRQCCVGTELVDWLVQQSACVHTRSHAVGMWQTLLEEGVLNHVDQELGFQDKYLFYRFLDDEDEDTPLPSEEEKRESEEELPETILFLAQIGPDALLRMILRKSPGQRSGDDLEIIYDELLHIKALAQVSNTVKRELASVLIFESHAKAGTVLFNQGEEGTSWYIIQKGSVNVVIYGKGVVCTLHEGDDFGKLALVTDSPRAASIVLREDHCHFLRVDKEDFNRILRERLEHTVAIKRKVLTLALRWASTHSYLLQEEPAALSFLEKTLIRQFSNGEDRLQKKQPIRNQDDILLKVYCSDHTYTTIRVAVAATGREVISAVADKLGINDELLLVHLSSAGEKLILKPNDVSVFSTLGINGRLFSCPREQLNALVERAAHFPCTVTSCCTTSFGTRTNFRRTTANLDLFLLRRFNQVQLWVVTEVCLCGQLSKRVQLLRSSSRSPRRPVQEPQGLPTHMSPNWRPPIIPFMPLLLKGTLPTLTRIIANTIRQVRHWQEPVCSTQEICQPNKNHAECPGLRPEARGVVDNQRARTQLSYRPGAAAGRERRPRPPVPKQASTRSWFCRPGGHRNTLHRSRPSLP